MAILEMNLRNGIVSPLSRFVLRFAECSHREHASARSNNIAIRPLRPCMKH